MCNGRMVHDGTGRLMHKMARPGNSGLDDGGIVYKLLCCYRKWESVTELQHALKRPTWEELIEKRTAKFMLSVSQCAILNA